MPFTVKNWVDDPSTTTPISAAALEDLEARVTAYADTVAGDAVTFQGNGVAYFLARANHTGTQLASTISDFSEAVDDRVNALLVEGANTTLTYDDTLNTLTIASTGGGGGLIDAIGDTNTVDLTVTGTTLTADIATTATLRVQHLGVNVAAPATAGYAYIGTRLGVGVSPGFPFQVESAGDLAYFRGLGVNTRLLLDTNSASRQAVLIFSDQTVTKWSLGKQTDSNFLIYNNTANTTQTATQNALLIESGSNVIQLGAGIAYDGAINTTPVRIDCTMNSFTGGHFGTRSTDSITSDEGNTASGVHWNFYHGGAQIADKGSLTMFAGYITANQFDAGNDTYLETVVYEGQTTINRAGGSFQVAEFVNRITAGNPARSSVASLIIEESNPIADYTETVFGTGSRFAAATGRIGLGSIGLTVMSNLTRRGGTAIWIGGYHASQYTSAGAAGVDTREFERALVVTVGAYVGVPGTDVLVIRGDGIIDRTRISGTPQFFRGFENQTDASDSARFARFQCTYKGDLSWGPGGATALDVTLVRVTTPGLALGGSLTISTTLTVTGTSTFTAAISVGTNIAIQDATQFGFIQMNEQATADPAAPVANAARIFIKDNGAGKTQACVRFNTGAVQPFATEP